MIPEEQLKGQIGRIPAINIKAETLSEAFHKTVVSCYELGCRVETPKHQKGMSLGYDANITVEVTHPSEEPIIHKAGIHDDPRGLEQYFLEVTHGIHNHWKKDPNDPNDERWGYTYNERFTPQIPFVLQRIKNDFNNKGRISGRDYFFIIWRPEEDSILEQQDPPCWQNGQLRFIQDEKGDYYLNYLTIWRSRDLIKAWLENNIAQSRLHNLFARKISDMLGTDIKMGSYIDVCNSLHIYGLYLDRDKYDVRIANMRRKKFSDFTMNSKDYLGDESYLKKIIAAQMFIERDFGIKNASLDVIKEKGYDLKTLVYPGDWDTWPKEWDIEPNKNLLK